MALTAPGVRVVRGPDWTWSHQDGGEGFVGTVVEIGRSGSRSGPEKTVVVQWDTGGKTNYRVGYLGAYDLRVFDNAQIGVTHLNISCSSCHTSPIRGVLWKCKSCRDTHLCSTCYMANEHDISHKFSRTDYPGVPSVDVSARQGQEKVEAKGIFTGARVVRGPDWEWCDQDGGDGHEGHVVDILNWESESGRSVARVRWQVETNVYRLAHEGKVDLKLASSSDAGSGSFYYRDHLPVLGKDFSPFRRGEMVRVDCPLEKLKVLQDGHGGWNDKMGEYINREGTVHRITDKGDIRVQFPNCASRWTFNPAALRHVINDTVITNNLSTTATAGGGGGPGEASGGASVAREGEVLLPILEQRVQLCADEAVVQRGVYQGQWKEEMKTLLGKVGQVTHLFGDDTIQLTFDLGGTSNGIGPSGDSVFYTDTGAANPSSTSNMAALGRSLISIRVAQSCCKVEWTSKAESSLDEVVEKLTELRHNSGPDRLVRESTQGGLSVIQNMLVKCPTLVNARSNGKTALQVASHEGHFDIVTLLLDCGAHLDSQDDEGDSPLHYACFGNQPKVAKYLLERGANVDAINNSKCTPLHVSVSKQHIDCVDVLLHFNPNVNLQDSYGDAPLHDAISKSSLEVIRLLLNSSRIDLSTRNHRKFNCLHYAALKGHADALALMAAKRPDLLDARKEDGFSALHLTSLNGHAVAADHLLTGGADPDIKNRKLQTPLHLAVSQGHAHLVDILVDKGCKMDAVDEEGNCCFHVALQLAVPPSPLLLDLEKELKSIANWDLGLTTGFQRPVLSPPLLMTAYLFKKGASLALFLRCRNARRKSPSDCLKSLFTSPLNPISNPHSTAPTVDVLVDQALIFLRAWAQHCLMQKRSPQVFCTVCQDDLVQIKFEPCGHRISCQDCCVKMKRCLTCQEPILHKIKEDLDKNSLEAGWVCLSSSETKAREAEELRLRLQELEDSVQCVICMDAPRQVAFKCGHTACVRCAAHITVCHHCRLPIVETINLF